MLDHKKTEWNKGQGMEHFHTCTPPIKPDILKVANTFVCDPIQSTATELFRERKTGKVCATREKVTRPLIDTTTNAALSAFTAIPFH